MIRMAHSYCYIEWIMKVKKKDCFEGSLNSVKYALLFDPMFYLAILR